MTQPSLPLHDVTDATAAWATFDGDAALGFAKYRYTLGRRWADGPRVLLVGHNPSTARADEEDATSRRYIGFGKLWGFGSYVGVNFAAAIATDKKMLPTMADPFGPRNVDIVLEQAAAADKVVVCCGSPGSWKAGAERARALIDELAKHHDLYGVGDPQTLSKDAVWDERKNVWRRIPQGTTPTPLPILTADGFPTHLLYQPARLVPVLWRARG